MLKRICAAASALVLVGLLAGCGAEVFDESTISIDKKGRVLSYSVEEFDEGEYSQEGFNEFVEEEISEFAAENPESKIKLNTLDVEDGIAKLSISFEDCEDYSDFSGEVLYNDSVVNAKAEGFDFDKTFYSVSASEDTSVSNDGSASDGNAVYGAETDADSIISDTSLKVVITSEHTDIKVPGTIVFTSDKYASLKSDDVIDLCEDETIYEEGLVYVVYK